MLDAPLEEKEKTVTMAFRLPYSRADALKKESEQNRFTPNALLNKIISDHIEFHALSKAAGLMPFHKKMLVSMIQSLDESELKELSKLMAKDFSAFVLMKSLDYSFETFLKSLTAWIDAAGYSYKVLFEDDRKIIIIYHDMGESWSLFMIMFLRESLEMLTDRKIFFEHSETVVAVTIS